MAGLAESMWAHAPSTPSISTTQNATKPSREPRNPANPSSRNGPRRRSRGGNGTKPLTSLATVSDTTPSTQSTPPKPIELSVSSAAPKKDTNTPSQPSRPRAPPRRNTKPDSSTVTTSGSINIASSTNTAPPTAKDDTAASDAGSQAARKNTRKRATRPANRRKASLAISVTSTANDVASPIVEPATPLTPGSGADKAITTVDAAPEAPDSPKATSNSSSGPETIPPSTPMVTESTPKSLNVIPSIALHNVSVRPSTPASASHLDWADEDEADDLPDLDDWGVTPAKHDDEPKGVPLRRKSSAAKLEVPKGSPKAENRVETLLTAEPATLDGKDSSSPISPTASTGYETVTSSAESALPANGTTRPFKRERHPLTEEQAAEKRRIKNREARERRKVKRVMTEGNKAGQRPATPSEDLASKVGGLAVNDAQGPKSSTSNESLSSLPPKLASAPTDATTTSNRSPPASSSLPARPSQPSSPSPTTSGFPPRRKPFAGEPSFLSGQRRQRPGTAGSDLGGASPGPGTRSGGSGPGRRERPVSHHAHATRPVISQNALSQLTKSLSGGARTHKPTVASE